MNNGEVSVFWITDTELYIKVNGNEERLTVEQARSKYANNNEVIAKINDLLGISKDFYDNTEPDTEIDLTPDDLEDKESASKVNSKYKNMGEMLTVKEWAEKAGLKLYNYDGFTEIYSRLSGNSSGDFETHMTSRFRDAGDLLCTRIGFESGLFGCTMEFPEMSQYEKMAEVIPEFVEGDINMRISAYIGSFRHGISKGDEIRTDLENVLSLLKHKATIREKSIKINNAIDEETEISVLDTTYYSPSEMEIVKEHNGTVESLEVKLLDDVTKSIEGMLQKKNLNLSEIPTDKLRVLTSILYSTARRKGYSKETYEEVMEEFMYINVPGQKKEQFIKTYNMIDGGGIRSGVAFDFETESGRVSGAMPTTPEVNDKIQEKIGAKDIDLELSEDETNQALQVIDNKVTAEERKSLTTRIKEFAKKMLDKIKGRDEGR